MIRVQLVDDDAMSGRRPVDPGAAEDVAVVAEAADDRDAPEQARAHRPNASCPTSRS